MVEPLRLQAQMAGSNEGQEIDQGLACQLRSPRVIDQGMARDGFLADGLPLARAPAVALNKRL